MMLSDHESVAIAQCICYVPVIPVTMYLLVKNWPIGVKKSRLPWITLASLSLIRFIGAVLVIAKQSNPRKRSLIIAIIILLNVGLVPLIASAFGIMHIMYEIISMLEERLKTDNYSSLSSSFEKTDSIYKTTIPIRVLFIAALSLLISGAVVGWNGNLIGRNLVLAGYAAYAAIVSIVVATVLHLRYQISKLAPESLIYLHGATLAIPFLILRTVYSLLSAFEAFWNPVTGSAVAFSLGALLPEYITIIIYSYLGFRRIREDAVCSAEAPANCDEQSHKGV